MSYRIVVKDRANFDKCADTWWHANPAQQCQVRITTSDRNKDRRNRVATGPNGERFVIRTFGGRMAQHEANLEAQRTLEAECKHSVDRRHACPDCDNECMDATLSAGNVGIGWQQLLSWVLDVTLIALLIATYIA